MSYATLEEVWGSDFSKKKKSKKMKRLENKEKKLLNNAIDSQIVIPKMADNRKSYRSNLPDNTQLDSFNGYDTKPMFGSSLDYQSVGGNQTLGVSQQTILNNNNVLEQTANTMVPNRVEGPLNNMIQISKGEYENLKNRVVEGFSNQTDEQFNQLILYIFTSIVYLLMMDMMYQLGKRSY